MAAMTDDQLCADGTAVLASFEEHSAAPAGLMVQGVPGKPFRVVHTNPTAVHQLGVRRVQLHEAPLEWAELPTGLAGFLSDAFEAFGRNENTAMPVFEVPEPVKAAYSVKMTHQVESVRGAEVHWFYFSFSDVTAWLNLQEEVMNARRLESIGALASGVAHDFNNLLMVIRGHADFISAIAGGDDSVAYSVDQIRRACHSGAGLTQSLLGFARKQSLVMQPMNVGQLVGEVVDLCRRTYGVRYQIEVDPMLDGGPDVVKKHHHLMIHGCAAALGHCLLNVLNNARDSMPDGGRITVRQRVVNDCIHLSVGDQGVGIDAADLRQIFEPFFTTKKKGAGTGLGLALALSIMKQHGGEILIESERGAGTTVSFVWPQLPTDKLTDAATLTSPAPKSVSDVPQRAFLIDDDEMVLNAVARLLKVNHVETETFSKPEAALARLRSGDLPTLIMVDYTMPMMDGVSCLREVMHILRSYANSPYMKLVLISGHPPEYFDAFTREFKGSPIYLLQKPFSSEDVTRILQITSKKVLRRTTGRVNIAPDLVTKTKP
jgi:two-component system, cell cycle sensor histidine kinase and response regulator CckA